MTNAVNNVSSYPKNNSKTVEADKNIGKTNETKENAVKANEAVEAKTTSSEAVVYEKSESTKNYGTYDKTGKALSKDTIQSMKNEAEARYSQMIETIKQMIARQGKENGAIPKDLEFFNRIPKTIEELNASKGFTPVENGAEVGDINDAENYWSAEQTSDRIVEFAKQISGGDAEKYALLKDSIIKGFDAASSYFDKMPDITGKTKEMVMDKLDKWAGKGEYAEKPVEEGPAKVEA